jgi:hypothetical protein
MLSAHETEAATPRGRRRTSAMQLPSSRLDSPSPVRPIARSSRQPTPNPQACRLQVRRNFEAGPSAPTADPPGAATPTGQARASLHLNKLLLPLLGAHRLFADAVHGVDFDLVVEHAPLLRLNPVATSPGWKQFAVTPVPSRRRASSIVNRMLASLVSQ